MSRSARRLALVSTALVAVAFAAPGRADELSPQQQFARDVYKELVEIDTTTATGDTLAAAQAMAARLKAAGGSGHRGTPAELAPINFWLRARLLASRQAQRFMQPPTAYFAFFTAMTSISTRNPGLASAATPTTERAGRLGWLPAKNWV